MKKHHSWIAWLAAVSLHGLAAGLYWVEPARLQAPAAARQETRTIEVQLHADQHQAMSDPQQMSSDRSSPASELMDAGGVAGAATEPATSEPSSPVTGPAILPAPELPYLPAGTLDSRPRAETPVIIPFPDAQLNKTKVTGILVLYVGADGLVDRVEVDQSDLPPLFEKAAIEAFRQTRMQPGIKDGKPIRARMKVLVEFEAR